MNFDVSTIPLALETTSLTFLDRPYCFIFYRNSVLSFSNLLHFLLNNICSTVSSLPHLHNPSTCCLRFHLEYAKLSTVVLMPHITPCSFLRSSATHLNSHWSKHLFPLCHILSLHRILSLSPLSNLLLFSTENILLYELFPYAVTTITLRTCNYTPVFYPLNCYITITLFVQSHLISLCKYCTALAHSAN